MKHQQEAKVWLVKCILITMVAVLALSAACHPDNKVEGNRAAAPSTQPSRQAEGDKATMPATQPNDKGEGNPATTPNIKITLVPHRGAGPTEMERIGGTVSGVNVEECKVVIFARGGDTWYVQPYIDSPYTPIDKDGKNGKWENDTHLGSRYAALLIRYSDNSPYKPPSTTGTLPRVGGVVLAIAEVPAKE